MVPVEGPFYHGTKSKLAPGDLITPGYRSNYGGSRRTSAWVYMSATLSPWGAELAAGDGPGRIYIVEPTGPIEDDPDLTDKRFPGNPTRSYRSRLPLRVIGEVVDWVAHSEEEIATMKRALDRHRNEQAERIARIPTEAEVDRIHQEADTAAREWASDAAYVGCALLMVIRGVDVAMSYTMSYASPIAWHGENHLSGKITEVTAWREGWAAVIESCITEIGLSVETRIWVAVDAFTDTVRFQLDAEGPQRSWQRNISLAGGVLTDSAQGELWDFAAGPFFS
jgi:hypothetical protein